MASGADTRRFLYDGDALVAEYGADSVLTHRYVHGPGVDEPQIWYKPGDASPRRFQLADHQGSIIGIATNESAGKPFAVNTYDAYGIAGEGHAGSFGYTGQLYLKELGLYHYKARMYSPIHGRFLQTGPVGNEDQINLYAYVHNDPVNMIDPQGEIGWALVGAIAGAAVGVYAEHVATGGNASSWDYAKAAIVGGAAGAAAVMGGGVIAAGVGDIATGLTATALNVAGNSAVGVAIGANTPVARAILDGDASQMSVTDMVDGAVDGALLSAAGATLSEVVGAGGELLKGAKFAGARGELNGAARVVVQGAKEAVGPALDAASVENPCSKRSGSDSC